MACSDARAKPPCFDLPELGAVSSCRLVELSIWVPCRTFRPPPALPSPDGHRTHPSAYSAAGLPTPSYLLVRFLFVFAAFALLEGALLSSPVGGKTLPQDTPGIS